MSGRLAFLFKEDQSLSDLSQGIDHKIEKCKSMYLTNSMKRGEILPPSAEFLQDVENMEYEFCLHHNPLPNMKKGVPGLISEFVQKLKKSLPHRDSKILKEFAKQRTEIQRKTINERIQDEKKDNKIRSSLRGAMKNAQYARLK